MSASPLVGVARAIGLSRWRTLIMVMGNAYIDESGHPHSEVYLALGGLAATAERWEALERDWELAKQEFSFPRVAAPIRCNQSPYYPFHCTDVFSAKSKFAKHIWPVNMSTKRALYARLVDLVATHVQATGFTLVLREAYKSVLVLDSKKLELMYAVAALGLVSRLYRWSERENEPLSYIFEKATGVHQGQAIGAVGGLMTDKYRDFGIQSVTTMSKGQPGLDAAEIWCYELRKHVDGIRRGKAQASEQLVKLLTIRQHGGYVMGKNALREWVDYIAEHGETGKSYEVPISATLIPFNAASLGEILNG